MREKMSTEYELASGVSPNAVNRFFEECKRVGNEIHTLQIWQNGKKMVRIAPSPYSCEDKRENYSLSKSFASTAVGFAVEDGLLHTDDRIVDLFPDKLPENVSDHLAAMRLSHVLSMNCGHENCVMPQMSRSHDVVRAFLAQPVPYEPGTHFTYNTGATCLLSALIQRVTGETLYDYVNRRLFVPLGISGAYWTLCGEGVSEGGCGLHLSCDDLVKFGQLYLDEGLWQGQRLLSADWVREASRSHSDNRHNGTPDWTVGYGYQFWRNARGGYRGDGACGQMCLILPKYRAVAVAQAMTANTQKEIDDLIDLVEHLGDPGGQSPEIPAFDLLPKRSMPVVNTIFRLEPNVYGWTALCTETRDDSVALYFSDGSREQMLSAGCGFWTRSSYRAPYRKPKLLDIMDHTKPDTVRVASCCTEEDGAWLIRCRHVNSPHTEHLRLVFGEDGREVELRFESEYFWDDCGKKIQGKIRE